MKLKLTIIAENYSWEMPYGDNGLSIFLEIDGQRLLFDTGSTGICAVNNARTLGLPLQGIDGIILSHGHTDHTGGLYEVLQTTGPATIYAHPAVFQAKYSVGRDDSKNYAGIPYRRDYLEDGLKATFSLHKSWKQLSEHLYMTGEVLVTNDFEKIPENLQVIEEKGQLEHDTMIDDNSLIVDTKEGLLCILGCAHRGLVNIMEYAKQQLNKPIYGIIGGTHLIKASDQHFQQVVDSLKEEELKFLAPGHCTGLERIAELKAIFPDVFKPAHCGQYFEFEL